MKDSLSPVALSRLTWTADDRQAWKDTYRLALLVAAGRDERAIRRDFAQATGRRIEAIPYYAERYSIHADNYGKGS